MPKFLKNLIKIWGPDIEDIECDTRSVTPPPNYDSPEVAIEFRDEKDICPRLSGRICFIIIVVTIVIIVAVGLGVGLNHAHHLGQGSSDGQGSADRLTRPNQRSIDSCQEKHFKTCAESGSVCSVTWNRPDYSRRVTRSPVIISEDVEESLFLGNVSICTSHSSQNLQGLDCSPFRKVFY